MQQEKLLLKLSKTYGKESLRYESDIDFHLIVLNNLKEIYKKLKKEYMDDAE